MTVSELIVALQKLPQGEDIFIEIEDMVCLPVTGAEMNPKLGCAVVTLDEP